MADKSRPESLLAIAIETRVDLRLQHGSELIEVPSEAIPPASEYYFSSVYNLLHKQLNKLIIECKRKGIKITALFESIEAIVVSVPGVVRNYSELIQLPLWNRPRSHWIEWQKRENEPPKRYFNFPEELCDILGSLLLSHGEKWSHDAKIRFKEAVFVINDATACAAYEYKIREKELKKPKPSPATKLIIRNKSPAFAYLKMHRGINVSVMELDHSNRPFINLNHPEAGHSYPIAHPLDGKIGFEGACPYHTFCLEGMISDHSFYQRANNPSGLIPGSWKAALLQHESNGIVGRELDKMLLNDILGKDQNKTEDGGLGIEIIAHYVSQLVYQIAIGPLAPDKIVLGGRMAKPNVVDAIQKMVVARWAKGYPMREKLGKEVDKFIIRTEAKDKNNIEVLGALQIANWGYRKIGDNVVHMHNPAQQTARIKNSSDEQLSDKH